MHKYDIHPHINSKIINDLNEDILFTWCHLSLKLLIHSDIGSRHGINISTESAYGTKLLNIKRPAVHRIHYGKDIRVKIIKARNHFARITYGILLSSKKKIGLEEKTFVTKRFNYYLMRMSSYLHQLLLNKRCLLNLQSVDLTHEFNHCTKLLYYTGEMLKISASLGFHCDITYNHKGIYVKSKNGQMDNTPTVIIVLGDTRTLNWQRQFLITTTRGTKKWVTDHTWKAFVHMKNLSILIVSTVDEVPTFDANIGLYVRYRHGGVRVVGSKLSIGFVFRVVRTWAVYDEFDKLLNVAKMSECEQKSHDKQVNEINVSAFHEALKSLHDNTINK